jgi:hypothetical protein
MILRSLPTPYDPTSFLPVEAGVRVESFFEKQAARRRNLKRCCRSRGELCVTATATMLSNLSTALLTTRPDHVAGPITVAKPGSIKNDDPIVSGGQIDQSARVKILNHAAIAVKKDERFARASFHVMKPDSVDQQEFAEWRVIARGFPGEMAVRQG